MRVQLAGLFVVTACASIGWIGCGGQVDFTVANPDGGTDGSTDGSTDETNGSCPTDPPTVLSACTTAMVCTYGGNGDPCSGTSYACNNGEWQQYVVDCFDAGTCPSSQPTDGTPCDVPSAVTCSYGGPCGGEATCTSGRWQIEEIVCDVSPPPGGCPSSLPSQGSACTTPGLACGYGDDPRPDCRPVATCNGGGWNIPLTGCPPIPSSKCPDTAAAAQGQSCPTAGAICSYGNIDCGCTACPAGPCTDAQKWFCDTPPTDPACPPRTPNVGTACTTQGTSCTYGSCGVGTLAGRECDNGVWVSDPIACAG